MSDLFNHQFVNDDIAEERTVALHDGPLDGQRVIRPIARMRKTQHAQGFRLPDDQQPWNPMMPPPERVKFAVYLWLVSEQRYCWVDYVIVNNEVQLMQALEMVAES
jgi:hypothetical protein